MNTPFRGSIGDETARAHDLKNLHLAVVLHYVAGALLALLSCVCFVLTRLAMAAAMASLVKTPSAQDATSSVLPILAAMGWVAVALGWTIACVLVHAGRSIDRRRRLRWCQAVAAVSTLCFPFGTGLGIFTLILLGKPHVRAQFGEDTAPPPAPPPTPFVDNAAKAGWVSPDAKRRFSLQAILVGGVFLFIQLAVPMVHSVRVFSRVMHHQHVIAEAGSAVTYADHVWFIERVSKLGETGSNHLANVSKDNDGCPIVGLEVPIKSRLLAADGPRLWVLGERTLAYYEAGQLTTSPSGPPNWPSLPFEYGGHPAFFDWNWGSDEIRMLSLEYEGWHAVVGRSWKASSRLASLPVTWAVLPADSGFDVFMQFGQELRWRHIGAGDGLEDPLAWESVSSSAKHWAAVRLGDESVVVLPTQDGLFDRRVSLLHRIDAGWVVKDVIQEATLRSVGAIASGSDSMDLVLSQPDGVETLALSAGAVQTRHKHAQALAPPFDLRSMIGMAMFGFIPALLAAALIGHLMRRDRTGILAGERPLRFASLLRRGFAYGIDHSPVSIIAFVQAWHVLRIPPETLTQAQLRGPFVLALEVWIGTLLVTSTMEGRWGVTPGKWLLGIRAVDIKSGDVCGFWRALLRRVLQLLDGSLGFFVGIFTVAFTPNWQRIGDLAAKTVVIRPSR
jgi:uncharacterized RDD family membrane protein YckC